MSGENTKIKSLAQSYIGKKKTVGRVREELIKAMVEAHKTRSIYSIHQEIKGLMSYGAVRLMIKRA